jgi:very-short-patch-repair endonuclease
VSKGLLTPGSIRSSAWRQLYRGVYADSDVPDTFRLRITGAVLLVPPTAAFSGRAAAYLHGAEELADLTMPVEVTVPTGVRFGPVTGLRVRRADLASADVTTVRRRRCTTGLATAVGIARNETVPASVVALDILLRRGITDRRQLENAVAALGSARGARRAQRATELADPRAESQPESTVRVLLALAGIETVPQFTVRDGAGRFIARVDLALPELRVAIEYDGVWHGAPGQLARDRRRLNDLTAAGWKILFITAADMHDPVALVAKVRAFLLTVASDARR